MARLRGFSISIKTRLIALGLAIFLSLGGLGAFFFTTLRHIQAKIDEIHEVYNTLERGAADAAMGAFAVDAAGFKLQASLGGPAKADTLAYFGYAKDAAKESFDAFLGLSTPEESMTMALESLKTQAQDYLDILGEMQKAAADAPTTLADLVPTMDSRFSVIYGSIRNLTTLIKDSGDKAYTDVTAVVGRGIRIFVLVALGLLLLVGGLVVWTIASIVGPLRKLRSFVETTGAGDLREATGIAGRDEMGLMAASLDSLVASLRSLIATVKDRVEGLSSTGLTLASTMEQTGAAVIQINANIGSTGAQLKEQSAAVSELSAYIEEVAKNIESLGARIGEQAGIVTEASGSVGSMVGSMEAVAKDAEAARKASRELSERGLEGKTQIDEMGESVASIVHSSESLGEAATIISDIAGKTSLLAMNAAIEAAHAGEAGKGFAVVADEIQRLSVESTIQAKEIGSNLEAVATSIGNVKAAAEAAVEAFGSILEMSRSLDTGVASMAGAMEAQGSRGSSLLAALARLEDMTREIQGGSAEMAQGNAAMLGGLSKLKDVTQAVLGNNEEILLGTEEINRSVVDTTELASATADHIAKGKEATERFLV